jgi:hypothetical protein
MAVLIAAFLSVAPFVALTVASLAPAASGSWQTGQGQYRQLITGFPALVRWGDGKLQLASPGVSAHWWPGQTGPARTSSHGSRPRVAVTSHGQSSGQRPGARQPRPPDLVAGLLLSMLAILFLATLVLGTGLAVHRVLLRRRLVAWECDWAYIEPRWTQRR